MLTIKECRTLLEIATRQTINEHLKSLNFFGRQALSWDEFRRLLELQLFLGLKPGTNSKAEFFGYSSEELKKLFTAHAVNIDGRLKILQQKHASHDVSTQKKRDRIKQQKSATLNSRAGSAQVKTNEGFEVSLHLLTNYNANAED
jgi:hypothetical protein